ncbi:MAG: hypothetical protein AAF611_03595 [Bacteroidota bacterium]
MRFLKILLTLCSVVMIGAVIYVVWFELSRANFNQIPFYLYMYLGFAVLSSVVNIIYHTKSYRFYRRKGKRQLDKKVHKILWVGTICFSTFLLYIGGVGLYTMIRFIEYGYNTRDVFMILLFIVPGFVGFLEASLLKKRIRRLRNEHDTLEEIENIGKEVEY